MSSTMQGAWTVSEHSSDEQPDDASPPSPHGPATRSGERAAEGRFARTRQAVEAERSDAEGAWSHVLRTPEEIGATQESRLGGLLRRPFRFGKAAQAAASPAAAGGASDDGRLRSAGATFARRPSRAPTAARRNAMVFVAAFCVGALMTSLLFGGLLGLPDEALTSWWASRPFAREERRAAPPERGEVGVAGVPGAVGQGGPEIALRSKADGASNAMDVAARAARSEPSVSDLVVAGSAPDPWQHYYRLGRRLHAEGDLGGAVEMYQRAATLEPDDATTLYNWARALQMLGARDAAIQKYRAAMELAPDSQTGVDARARLSELQGH